MKIKVVCNCKDCLIAETQNNPLTELIEYMRTVWVFIDDFDDDVLYGTIYLEDLPLFTIRRSSNGLEYIGGPLPLYLNNMFTPISGFVCPSWSLKGALVLLRHSSVEWSLVDVNDPTVMIATGSFEQMMNNYIEILI